MTSGELCKNLRERAGLSMVALSKAIGVSPFTIKVAESEKAPGRQKNTISKKTAEAYKKYFGVDVLTPEIGQEMNIDPDSTSKSVDYSYTADSSGYIKANDATTTKEELKEQNARYVEYCDKLEKELESEKAHSDFYEKKFRELQEEVNTYKNLYKQVSEKLENLSSESDGWRAKYDDIYNDLMKVAIELREKDELLLEVLISWYKNHTNKPD